MKKLFSVRTIILAGSLLLQLSTLCFHSRGAAGDVDLSFDPGSGVNGTVNAVVLQPDGKVIIGGHFTTVKGLARPGIARLNADGSGDPTFNPGTGPNYGVSSLALQSDGKVLIGGDFTTVNGRNRNAIARLNSNGSLDSSFNPVVGPPYVGIFSIVLQSDGKVFIGGDFATVNGTFRNGIARLNADGSLDSSFNSGTGVGGHPAGVVGSIVVRSDGKVLIGGEFSTVNGTNRNGIARLNANGSLDSSFDPGTGADWVSSIVLQPDGKVLFGGYGIARLNSDGSPDTNFNANANGGWDNVASIIVQSDGKVLIGGDFITFYGANSDGIARINANGSVDGSFNPGTVVGSYPSGVNSVAVQSDGKVFIGGYFSGQIARLNIDGSLDGSFHPGSGLDGSISSLVAEPTGKVLIGGVYTFINGTNRFGGQLNADGSRDSTFISSSFNPDLAALIQYDDCGSQLCSCEKSTTPTVLVQADGRVLIGGYVLTTVSCYPEGGGQISRYFLARFNTDGSLDTSFEAAIENPTDSRSIAALAVQQDGKVIVGGNFSSIKGTNRNGIARLNTNGSLDNSFNAGTGNYSSVSSVALQSDGKVLIGGGFTVVNGTNRNNIARLNANGSLDSSFNPGTGVSGGSVYSVALEPDGKVLVGGSFTTINGTNRNNIGRLNANGSLDTSFKPGTGADGRVRSIALQSDGNVLIGGDFTIVNGAARPRVARLYGDSVAPSLNIARSNAFVSVSWPVTGLNYQLQETTNLFPAAWSPIAQSTITNAGQISVAVPTTAGRRFFRLISL